MADQSKEQHYGGEGTPDANGVVHENGAFNVNRDAGEVTESGNKFQQAIAAWRALDLTKLVSDLDTAASELVEHQKESLVQRKDLAQKTKDFRKLDDASKLVEIKDLLKSYQTYIDVLTNHSKSVSAAFMQAYTPLSEAPDPYPLLEASIDSLIIADEVTPKLEAENQRLQKQVAKVTSQLEDSEKELEGERSMRQNFEQSQDAKIKGIEESWMAALREKEENWTAKEHGLEEKVEHQDRLLKELKASYEVNQRLDKSAEDPQESINSTAVAAELEIANSELEKANVRLSQLESRNEQLSVELALSASQTHNYGRSTAVEEEPAYLRLRSENQSLMRKLESVKHDKEADRNSIETKLRNVERELQALKTDRDALQRKVHRWNDYDEIKRELDMLRAIEFSTVDDSIAGAEDDAPHANGSADKSTGQSLEQLLLARNKKLSNDLTELRVAHHELQERFNALQDDLSSTNMELERTRNLNATLENDLQRAQQEATSAFETASMAGTYTSRAPKSAYGSRRGGGASPTSSIIGGFDPSSGQGSPRTLDSLRAGEPVGGGSGILPMVTAQRDRFKKKMTELEQELQKQYQTVSSLRSEVASLQRDNLALYEKTRYVSTYNRGGHQASSGASYSANPNPSTVSAGPIDTPAGWGIHRYQSAYEQSMSPFAAFRGRESARALKRMSLPERVILQITRTVLATRTSRNLFALYCLGLHLLVIWMLYWMSTVDVERHASNLGANLIAGVDAAAQARGADVNHGDWTHEGFQAGS